MDNQTIYLSQFHGIDTMETIGKAMAYMREHPGTTLVMEPGTYTITTERARWTRDCVLNGSFGRRAQTTMFTPTFEYSRGIDFCGQKDSRLIAYGVTLMVDGFMEPISIRNCENVEVCGITIDHTVKPYAKGTVVSVTPLEDGAKMCACVEIPGLELNENTPIYLRKRFYDAANDRFFPLPFDQLNVEIIDKHHVNYTMPTIKEVQPGMAFNCVLTGHFRPAILIEHAKNTTLIDVTINSQPGMGIVGNRSEDILIRRLSVVPSLGEHWSTNTDATHFTSIKGTIRMENCMSEAHGDDFTNIHAYYHDVIKRDSSTVCYLQEKTPDGTHAQSLDYPDVGDTLELTDKHTMELVDTFTVLDCTPMHNEWMCKVILDHPLPENTDHMVIADVTRLPKVEIVGCTITSHYARSILIKTRNVLIERNFFKNALGMAIEIAAEAWWYEGVGPADVTIRGNRIVNCGCREAAGVVVKADSPDASGQSVKNVVIEDNIIDVPFAAHAIYVRNTDGVKIARNKCLCYDEAVIVKDCVNVIEE